MDSYEILKDQLGDTTPEGSTPHSPSIVDLGADLGSYAEQSEVCDPGEIMEECEDSCDPDGPEDDLENSEVSGSGEDEDEEEENKELVMENKRHEEPDEEHPDLRKRAPHEQTIS